eukprot:5915469-Alexandrium_andersonii.AAC.1
MAWPELLSHSLRALVGGTTRVARGGFQCTERHMNSCNSGAAVQALARGSATGAAVGWVGE